MITPANCDKIYNVIPRVKHWKSYIKRYTQNSIDISNGILKNCSAHRKEGKRKQKIKSERTNRNIHIYMEREKLNP